ncbi:hypothetical protein VTP01DRAFT_1777 [Rhizomucor pusillus]|uniref:uncharacterized protein n=1 Tax=Rhizomucor pusillus TaxID=4840 RepID=UPI003742E240
MRKSVTEEDFVGKVWSPVMEAMLEYDYLNIKWGDSVSDHSTAARKNSHEGEGITMGDRVDMRVTMEVDGKHYVLLNSVARRKEHYGQYMRSEKRQYKGNHADNSTNFPSKWVGRRGDGIDVACARSVRGTKDRIRSDTRFFWQPKGFAKMHPYITISEECAFIGKLREERTAHVKVEECLHAKITVSKIR